MRLLNKTVLAECFATFPHALIILVTALTLADARLYEAADALGTRRLRRFFTITLPLMPTCIALQCETIVIHPLRAI